MSYAPSGSLKTDVREVSISETWDTQTEWEAYQSVNNIDISSGVLTLTQLSAPSEGLLHQYDASSLSLNNNDTVTTFTDSEGTDDLAATGAPTYKTGVINNNPIVRYDGTDDFHHADYGTTISQPDEIFVVAQMRSLNTTFERLIDGNSDEQVIASDNSTPNWWYYSGSSDTDGAVDTNPHIHSLRFDGASSVFRLDGSQVAGGDVGSRSLTGFSIGARPDNALHAAVDVAEVLIYDPGASGYSRTDVETYLSDKWGIAV